MSTVTAGGKNMANSTLADTEKMGPFVSLPLHDAVLRSIEIEWKEAKCILELSAFLERNQEAQPCRVVFLGVTKVVVPREEPWGSSVYINGVSQPSRNEFRLEMQSGDELRIEAKKVFFETIS